MIVKMDPSPEQLEKNWRTTTEWPRGEPVPGLMLIRYELVRAREESIINFMDWLEEDQEFIIARHDGARLYPRTEPVHYDRQELILAYLGVDSAILRQERDALRGEVMKWHVDQDKTKPEDIPLMTALNAWDHRLKKLATPQEHVDGKKTA